MNIAMVANAAYAMPLAVTIRSVSESTSAPVSVSVLCGSDFTATLRAKVERSARNARWRWIEVEEPRFDDLPGCPVAYFKFLLADRLKWHRVIFLDCDLLVARDLRELWDISLDGYPVLAVRDQAIPTFGSPGGLTVADYPATPYFNSGVMLVDLGRWREESVGDQLVNFSRTHRIRYQDQDAFNFVFRNRWGMLPPHWNRIYSLSRRESLTPSLYHFAGAYKPWLMRTGDAIDARYYDVLDRTAWHGWRPAPDAKARLKVAYLRYLRRYVYAGESRLFQFLRDRV